MVRFGSDRIGSVRFGSVRLQMLLPFPRVRVCGHGPMDAAGVKRNEPLFIIISIIIMNIIIIIIIIIIIVDIMIISYYRNKAFAGRGGGAARARSEAGSHRSVARGSAHAAPDGETAIRPRSTKRPASPVRVHARVLLSFQQPTPQNKHTTQ